MAMEFLFFIVIAVIFVVQLVMKQVRKDDSSGSSLRGSRAAATKSARPQPRPRSRTRPRPQTSQPQTSQPKNLEEALRLSKDRSAPPAMRYAGLDHDDDDDGPAEGRSSGAAAPDDMPVVAEVARAELGARRVPEADSGPVANTIVGTEPAGVDPAGTGSAAPEPAGMLRPSEPFTPSYSASVYTPTSVYSSYTPTSLYTSGSSILDGEKPENSGTDSDEGAQDHEPDEDQRS